MLAVTVIWASSALIGFRGALAATTLLACAVTVAGFVRPQFTLLGLSMLATLDSASRVFLASGGLFRFNTLNYILLALMLLALPRVLRRQDVPTLLLYALILCVFLGMFYSPSPVSGIQHLLNIVTVPGLIIAFDIPGSSRRTWYQMGIINGLVAALGTASLYVSETGGGNANAWSYMPLTGLFTTCLALPFARDERNGAFWLRMLAAVNTVFVFLSGSRGAFAVAVCCVLFHLFWVPDFRSRLAFVLAFALIIIVASWQFAFLEANSLGRWGRFFDTSLGASERTSGRAFLVVTGLEIFSHKPLGSGTGAYALEFQPYAQATQAFSGSAMEAHSAWLKLLVENGLVGFILLVAYVGCFAFIGLARGFHNGTASVAVLTTAVLAVAFLSTEFASKGLWLMAAGTSVLLQSNRSLQRSVKTKTP